MKIDCEVSLKSLLFVAESLEQLLGQHGAQAVLRTAGRRAASSLIDMLPLTLPEDEAVRRSGAVLTELGFLTNLDFTEGNELRIYGNRVLEELRALGITGTWSVRFYVVGLFEGFYRQMSGSNRKIVSIESGQDFEIWRLG
jgi:hypothetical protein